MGVYGRARTDPQALKDLLEPKASKYVSLETTAPSNSLHDYETGDDSDDANSTHQH